MLQELLDDAEAVSPERRLVRDRGAARLGAISLWLLLAALVLQGVSLVQQLSYLFAPKPGELPILTVVLVAAVLAGFSAVVVGCMASTKADGRRTGMLGASLALGFLVLFGAASWFGWGFLGALSEPI